MQCPRCKQLEDKVIESRSLANGRSIRRRRECLSCGYRFTSYERIEEKPLMVIKKSTGRREPFDRGKIEKGIQQAVRKRPVSQMDIENMLDELEENVMMIGRTSHEISSSEIGKMVLDKLYHLDRVAYVRFASVYRNFENVEEFIQEIETLSGLNAPEETGQ
ncbi:MAG: transcriptional repressor NrdR [Spirochaetes bacterium]|jgi:transcriptional repressor NrdR|nr:transcriptional repressor NrdR [Spirochaetota bacterium]